MGLSKAFDEALVYASDLHRDQIRKGSGIPYIAHLMSVSSRVLSAGGTEIQAIGGLLHDAAEDQGGEATLQVIRKRFGVEVAQIVADCTDSWIEPKPEWRARKRHTFPNYRPSQPLHFWFHLPTRSTTQKRSSRTIVRLAKNCGNVSPDDETAPFGITGRLAEFLIELYLARLRRTSHEPSRSFRMIDRNLQNNFDNTIS